MIRDVWGSLEPRMNAALRYRQLVDAPCSQRLDENQLPPRPGLSAFVLVAWEPMQIEFNFEAGARQEGYRGWLEERQRALRLLASKLGLPLGRKVEVWLRGEIRLTGILRLREEALFVPEQREACLELVVDNVPFSPAEITSCICTDA
jgi:hypothetical protein